jgi:hypothetical protein
MTSSSKNGASAALEIKTKDGVKFGKELREKEFLFGNGFLNLNHGTLTCLISSHSKRYPFAEPVFMGAPLS